MYTSRRLVSAPSLAATFLLLPAARRRSVIRYESLKKHSCAFLRNYYARLDQISIKRFGFAERERNKERGRENEREREKEKSSIKNFYIQIRKL